MSSRIAKWVSKQYIIPPSLPTHIGQAGYDEEELESLIEESTEIFTQNLIKQTRMAQQQLSDLQERHEAFVKLEKSIVELHQLFQVGYRGVKWDCGEVLRRNERWGLF